MTKLVSDRPGLLTADDNRDAYEAKGYFDMIPYITEIYDQILCSRSVGDKSIMIMLCPDNKWKMVLIDGDKSTVFPYTMVTNDLAPHAHPLMLNTLHCSESDNSFLFIAENEDPDDNPSILEVFDINPLQ